MGFLDKVKAQATQVAEKAQEGVKAGQAKVEEAKAKRKADTLLRDLGAAVFAEKTGRQSPQTASEIERILAELRSHEETHGPITTTSLADDSEDDEG